MKHTHGVLLTLLAAVLWGTVGIGVQILQQGTLLQAEQIAFLRLLLATPALLLLGGRFTRPQPRTDLPAILLMGLGHALYCYGYLKAIPLTGVGVAVTVSLGATPLMLTCWGLWRKTQQPHPLLWITLALGMAGLGLLTGLQGTASASGVMLALLAALGWAVLIRGSERIKHGGSQTWLLALAFLAGALFLMPFAPGPDVLQQLKPAHWLVLVYLGVAPSALGYLLFQKGLKHISGVTAGLISLLEPLVSIVLARMLFGEVLHSGQWLGMGLLLLMLVLTALQSTPAKNLS